MKAEKIRKIFNKVFNNMPNPIFCHPCFYFKHKDFLCEVARTKSIYEMKWTNYPYKPVNPLLILEGLFVDDGFYITVLEMKSQTEFIHRTDLCEHIDNIGKISSFVNRLN